MTPHFLMKALLVALSLLPWTPQLMAQGDLAPPGGPLKSMKSLQEIWNKIATLESQVISLQAQNQNLSNLLLNIGQTTGAIPWPSVTSTPPMPI